MKFKFFQVILIVFLILPFITQGSVIDNINKQIQDQESKRAELEKQAQEYQAIINKKQGGSNKKENLIPLCPNHHRLVHKNKMELPLIWDNQKVCDEGKIRCRIILAKEIAKKFNVDEKVISSKMVDELIKDTGGFTDEEFKDLFKDEL